MTFQSPDKCSRVMLFIGQIQSELLISLAGKQAVCLTSDEVVLLKLKDDPRKRLFSTAEVTYDTEQ